MQKTDLITLCENYASTLAESKPDPKDWETWIVQTLVLLDQKARELDPENGIYSYADFLLELQERLRERARSGEWWNRSY